MDAGAWCAGIAFALVYPLLRTRQLPLRGNEEGMGMKRKPSIRSLEAVTLDEARAYLE